MKLLIVTYYFRARNDGIQWMNPVNRLSGFRLRAAEAAARAPIKRASAGERFRPAATLPKCECQGRAASPALPPSARDADGPLRLKATPLIYRACCNCYSSIGSGRRASAATLESPRKIPHRAPERAPCEFSAETCGGEHTAEERVRCRHRYPAAHRAASAHRGRIPSIQSP